MQPELELEVPTEVAIAWAKWMSEQPNNLLPYMMLKVNDNSSIRKFEYYLREVEADPPVVRLGLKMI